MYWYSVDLEDAADAGLAYLVRVEQLELLGALIEIVSQGDAVAPALDLPALGPELQIDRVTNLEAQFEFSEKYITKVDFPCEMIKDTRFAPPKTPFKIFMVIFAVTIITK